VVHTLSHLLHRLMGTAFGSESVRAVSETGFEDGLQDQLRGCLGDPVSYRWYAQRSLLTVWLGDAHPTHRARVVALLLQVDSQLG